MFYVGIDVAKEKHYVCVLNEEKELACKPFWIYSDCLGLNELVKRLYDLSLTCDDFIKDHPFNDGNKRSASFLFIYFLDKCDYLYKQTGEKKINENALTTLTLLIASSNPKEKDILIKLIKHLIFEKEVNNGI